MCSAILSSARGAALAGAVLIAGAGGDTTAGEGEAVASGAGGVALAGVSAPAGEGGAGTVAVPAPMIAGGEEAGVDFASVRGGAADGEGGGGLLAGASDPGAGAVAGGETTAGVETGFVEAESCLAVGLAFATGSDCGAADALSLLFQKSEAPPPTTRRSTITPSSTSVRVPIVRPRLAITGATGETGVSLRPPARACSAFFRASLMRLMAEQRLRG